MPKNILILVLMAGLAYCAVTHLRERLVVPDGAFGVVMESNGVVATDAVEPGPIWLWHGQTLLLYRSTPMDVTIPVRALIDVYDGRTVPALGITYSYAARTAQAFVGQRRNGLRRDERGLILAGFHEVVAAMRSALTGGALKLQERPGRDDIEGVRQFLTLIAEGVQSRLSARFGETLQVHGAWLAAPGFERIGIAFGDVSAPCCDAKKMGDSARE
ncbi:MAG: hypothetical protein EOM22_19620 [Gammaproteobacteria bacterium]|nr:hypothetical protein [Gammaproteobacteria bacterium]